MPMMAIPAVALAALGSLAIPAAEAAASGGDVGTGVLDSLAGGATAFASGDTGRILGAAGRDISQASEFGSAGSTIADIASGLGTGVAAAAPAAATSAGASLSEFAAPELLSAATPEALGSAISATAPTLAAASTGLGAAGDFLASSGTGAAPSAAPPSGLNKILNSLGLGGDVTPTGIVGNSPFNFGGPGGFFSGSGANPILNASGGTDLSASFSAPEALTSAAGSSSLSTGAVPADFTDQLLKASGAGGLTGAPTIAKTAPTNILDTIMGAPKAHPILSLLGGTAASQLLGPQLQKLTGSGLTSQEKALLAQEGPALNAANSLIPSLQTGVLPPGADAAVQQALNADIASIRSRYATTGQAGSAAEQQDIANAQQTAAANKFKLAQEATTTGLSALGLNQNVYQTLLQNQLSRQQQLSNAFSGLFNALGTGAGLSGALKTA